MLLLDKPVGLSSNAALQRARRLYGALKAGHTGTLDPLASGLLPVCFGEATKFSQVLLDAPKRYRATVRFGIATSTADGEGDVTARGRADFDRAAVEAALARFVGTIAQVPPRYAALKRDGRPYYAYARAGVEIERPPRSVVIASLTLVAWSTPDAVVDVSCSKGTYVRVLAEDVGAALGSCAHLAALRRTGSGDFDVSAASALDTLEALDSAALMARLLPIDAGVMTLPRLDLDAEQVAALCFGQEPICDALAARYRAYGPDRFVGVVEADGAHARAVRLIAEVASRSHVQDARSE